MILLNAFYSLSRVMRKPVFRVFNQVRQKHDCTATEDGQRIEILDLGRRGAVLCSENKGADQLCGHCAADLHLFFCICEK